MNPLQRNKTKHIEVDIHFCQRKAWCGMICTPYVSIEVEFADILTKGLPENGEHLFSSLSEWQNVF